ncbi:unnamed protein product [Ixodes persulcatus]
MVGDCDACWAQLRCVGLVCRSSAARIGCCDCLLLAAAATVPTAATAHGDRFRRIRCGGMPDDIVPVACSLPGPRKRNKQRSLAAARRVGVRPPQQRSRACTQPRFTEPTESPTHATKTIKKH